MNKKTMLGVAAVLVLIAAFAAIYVVFVPKGTLGAKTVTVEIVHGDSTTKTVELHTDKMYLGEALAEQEGLVVGENGPYGLYIKTVDNEMASDAEQTWWCVTKGGAEVTTGVDQTPVADGERYELTLLAY